LEEHRIFELSNIFNTLAAFVTPEAVGAPVPAI
jgi:hypothetical protein